ncbi:MAG: DUF1003 domain-containing protein [Casimicrobiaceae bacterium]
MERPAASADPVAHNIESISAFYEREAGKITWSQQVIESASVAMARPAFAGVLLAGVSAWIMVNVLARRLGFTPFDPPPFPLLVGVTGLAALLATTVVLIRQERLAKLEEQREHLDSQVILLTEQKTTKLINLIEELRRDLPMVANRVDAEAETMRQPADAQRVLAQTDGVRDTAEQKMRNGSPVSK